MRSRWLVALAFVIPSAPFAPSLAAPPSPTADDVQVTARVRGEQGLRLFEASQWEDAYSAFEAADTLYHAPTLVLYMAHCRRNQGKLLQARELYEKVAAEPVPKGAPEQFGKAVASARTELDSLNLRIPSVRVSINGASASRTQVTIDGAQVSAADQASGKPLDPGSHEIVANADGGASARKTIALKAGESAWVELVLQQPASPADASALGSRLPAVIAFGVGGVGVAVGVITGSLALVKINDIRSRCTDDGHCLRSDQAQASTAQALVTTSTVGFVAGGVGLAAGTLLWILRPGGAKVKAKASTHVEIGIGSIAIGGRF
jgi:hypothetical protein